MKSAVLVLSVIVVGLAIIWMTGLADLRYPNVVQNQPLSHPQKVREIHGTNLVLSTGEMIALSPVYPSERSAEEISLEFSNQLSRSDFEVEIAGKQGDQLAVFIKWPRKFRDSAPPFTIPLIPETVGRYYRKPLASGQLVQKKSESK